MSDSCGLAVATSSHSDSEVRSPEHSELRPPKLPCFRCNSDSGLAMGNRKNSNDTGSPRSTIYLVATEDPVFTSLLSCSLFCLEDWPPFPSSSRLASSQLRCSSTEGIAINPYTSSQQPRRPTLRTKAQHWLEGE